MLKRRKMHNALLISLPIAFILFICIGSFDESTSAMLLILAGCICVGGVLVGFAWSALHNPNREHPGRAGTNPKTMSRTVAVTKAELESANEKTRVETFRRLSVAVDDSHVCGGRDD